MVKGNIKFIKHELIEDFEIVIGTSVNNEFPVHMHQKYCIGIVENGNALIKHKNLETTLGNGYIYFINPKEPHQIKSVNSTGFNHIVLCFGYDFVNHYFSSNKLNKVTLNFKTPFIYDCFLFEIILFYINNIKGRIEKTNLEYDLMQLFIQMYQYFSFPEKESFYDNKRSYSVMKVCEYLEQNSKKCLSLNEMASIAGLSKFHFLRTFKDEIGISPYDFQIQAKIKLAREMLLLGYSSSYIAAELDFTDQSHFTRFFKRNTGITPSKFLKMNLEIQS